MKKTVSALGSMLFVLVVLLPLGTLLSYFFGYEFKLTSVSVFAIVTALISIRLAALISDADDEKDLIESGIVKVLFSLLTPLSIINAVFYMLECRRIWVVISVFICIGCCCYLTIKHGKPLVLRIIALVLSAFMILPVGYFGFIALIFGNIGQNTVVESVESPNGVYYAEVINSDQGALGGDTLVDVYENKGINALVFKISKKPQRVYSGDWGEFENMEIYWKDDNCLVINSVEYEVE